MEDKHSNFAWEMVENFRRALELGGIIKEQCADHLE